MLFLLLQVALLLWYRVISLWFSVITVIGKTVPSSQRQDLTATWLRNFLLEFLWYRAIGIYLISSYFSNPLFRHLHLRLWSSAAFEGGPEEQICFRSLLSLGSCWSKWWSKCQLSWGNIMKRTNTVILCFFFRNQCDGSKLSIRFKGSGLEAENGGKQQEEGERTRDIFLTGWCGQKIKNPIIITQALSVANCFNQHVKEVLNEYMATEVASVGLWFSFLAWGSPAAMATNRPKHS